MNMAAKSKAPKATNGTKGSKAAAPNVNGSELIPEDELASAPEGFEELFGERVSGWWALVPGNTIQGVLADIFETKSRFAQSGKKKVYKIRVTATAGRLGCVIHPDGAEDDGTTTAKVGDLVGVDEKGFLRSLSNAVVGQEIWIAYRGKEAPSADYPQGRHVFVGPVAKPAKVNPVTGEVAS